LSRLAAVLLVPLVLKMEPVPSSLMVAVPEDGVPVPALLVTVRMAVSLLSLMASLLMAVRTRMLVFVPAETAPV
jgi:hypothetical protein